MSLQALWCEVRDAAERARRNDPQFDGRGWWQLIKQDVSAVADLQARAWLPVATLPCMREPRTSTETEQEHFVRQHHRIPTDSPPTVLKILQLALNSGQLRGIVAARGREGLPEGYLEGAFDQLCTYISDQDASTLSAQIDLIIH
jgi:hypothetical protein